MLFKTATHLLTSCLAGEPAGIADTMTGLTVLDAFAGDPAAVAAQRAPEWIKLAPRGKFTARDGRVFEVDPDTLVSRFDGDGVDLPIDLDHATVKKAMFGDAAPALGWISKLEARADGLYGKAEWLDEGTRVLAARTHRYISPTLKTDDRGKAYWLHSAALVAAPAASMPALASAQPTTTEPTMLKAIAAALGLNEDAAETSCLSAITDLRKRIDPAVHEQTLATLSTVQAKLDGIEKTARKDKVDALLEGALTAKKISPAQRESYELLCATDDGLVQVTKLIETLGAGLAASGLDAKPTPGGLATLSAEDRDVMKLLGQTEEEFRKANGLAAA